MKKIPAKLALLAVAIGCVGPVFATGFYGPREYLSQGGKNLVASPEFYWELETKRLARDFHPKEKPMIVPRNASDGGLVDQGPLQEATANADNQDFADALKTGAIKPPDAAKATQQHEDARKFIAATDATTTGSLPDEFNSEFADYDRGAFAYRLGKDHWVDAQKAWEALLSRPAAERHYRTVWAVFMLGKLAMKSGDYPAAIKWFEKTREYAGEGFADSLGMAADSYGWEGRCEWKQDHPERAAPLFLTQLALGDESAIVSLKALIPDRDPVDGMLNYGPDAATVNNAGTPAPATPPTDPKVLASLNVAAANPLLRRLVTAHILATESPGSEWSTTVGSSPRSVRWLKAVSAAKPGLMQDAEYLGWLAYVNGDYKEAQRWLGLAKSDSPAAEWLHAKLELRDGKFQDAVQSLGKAFDTLRDPALYTGWHAASGQDTNDSIYVSTPDGGSWTMPECATGDLGQLHLERGDFVQAMDILLKGQLWEDASVVAERILTADELKAYVDKLPIPPPGAKPSDNDSDTEQLRYLLGRRLVREDRYAEAMPYMKAPYDKVLQKYVQALQDGANEKLPKSQRAKAWFTAAWLARYDGMELMGTEVSPDGFVSDGDFENTDLAQERLSGEHQDNNVMVKNASLASPQEVHRLEKNKIEPDIRYHYRLIAGALAMKAAALMEDNTEELADVINAAGNWVKDSKESTGDRYYQVIEKRADKTTIGAKVVAKHWFVDDAGPWSTGQQTAYDAMHKALGDPKTE